MSELSAKYHIYSDAGDDPNVGIWWLTLHEKQKEEEAEEKLIGQPVRLAVDLVEWEVTPPIKAIHPVRLGPGPYKYTTELEGRVFATNNPAGDRKWHLLPVNKKDAYVIAKDEHHKEVWTAREPGQPITIEPFKVPGDRHQVFKIVPIKRDD